MKCAICGSRELAVEITFRGMVACRFDSGDGFELLQPPAFESRWDDGSQVACLKCAWQGTVREAAGRSRVSKAATARSPRKTASGRKRPSRVK